MNQSVTLLSSSSDPDDTVHHQSVDNDDVTFQFNQIQISANEGEKSLQLTPEVQPEHSPEVSPDFNDTGIDSIHQSETDDVILAKTVSKSPEIDDVTFGFDKMKNKTKISENDDVTLTENDVTKTEDDVSDDEENEDDEGEFTFMCLNDDNDDVTKLYLTDEIGTVFPLFDQSLIYNAADNDNGKRINVPVDNVFIESPRRSSDAGTSTGTFTSISKETDINIKSNSTGFSKLWRFRDNNNMNRSHSDGRDAFVFLNQTNNTNSLVTATSTEGKAKAKVVVVDGGKGKVNEKTEVKKKVKKVKESAHEVYLKQKGGKGVEEKRKSYLPYRPGLMGFFTNVNGGLSKNVHPF